MPTPTWERLPEARRSAVQNAAEAEFGARGYSGASLNTICKKAGVSKGSLFQYFTDKADLYLYLTELVSRRIRAAMEAEAARLPWETDFFGALDEMTGLWVGYFYRHPRDLAMTAAANLEHDPLARAAVRAAVNQDYLGVLGPLIDLGYRTGQIREGTDRDALLAALLLVLPHVALAPHVSGLDTVLGLHGGDEDTAAAAARRLLRLILDPFRPAAPPRPASSGHRDRA